MTRMRVLVAAGAALLLLAGLGRLPLLDPDEGRYARASQEMLERGDLVVPVLDGSPRLQKPVLFYWLESGAFAVLGYTEAAARLPSALAAAGTLVWLFLFARRRLGEAPALLACSILVTTPLFFALARTATTDMLLTFFVFGATASLHAGIVEPSGRRIHVIAGGVCLGLGLLAKGPVALVIPAAAIPVAALARRREPITIAGRAVAAAWVMVLVALPWAILLFHRVGMEEVLEIWRREALERYSGGLDHPERLSYFLLTAPVTFFPWSAFVPFAVAGAFRRLRRGEGLRPLLLAWLLGGFLFFSLGSGKLDSYLLPLTPAAALLVAGSVASPETRRAAGRWAAWLMTAMAGLLLLPFPVSRLVRNLPALLPAIALVFAACALIAAGMSFLRRGGGLTQALASIFAVLWVGGALLLPLEWAESRTTKRLVREAGLEDPAARLYVLRVRPPSLGFYARRIPEPVPARYLLMSAVEDGGAAMVVLEERREEVIAQLRERGFHLAAGSGGLVAMRRSPPGPAGPP